jgi:hypothetical protein
MQDERLASWLDGRWTGGAQEFLSRSGRCREALGSPVAGPRAACPTAPRGLAAGHGARAGAPPPSAAWTCSARWFHRSRRRGAAPAAGAFGLAAWLDSAAPHQTAAHDQPALT